MKSAIERALRSEFHGQLSSRFNSELSKIKFRTESGITLVDILISDSSIVDIYVKDDLLYSDVTFIDSPVIMQLSHLIKVAHLTLFQVVVNRQYHYIGKT